MIWRKEREGEGEGEQNNYTSQTVMGSAPKVIVI